jgi:predicted AAA+ superfamily ATPase
MADSTNSFDFLHDFFQRAHALMDRLEQVLPQPLTAPDWTHAVAWRYRRKGLHPVQHIAAVSLSDLCEVDAQKERLVRNIAQFVTGRPANNVLLSGARGTGKSSLIKACLQHFASQGLRLIEMDKEDLADLPDLMTLLADRSERFIIFCDDLSFDEGESGYKALKSSLDGTIAACAANVLLVATSNRRHLLPETMRENLSYRHTEEGEVHPGEGIEEKISLSERFGLWISFYPFNQKEYLAIVEQWLTHFGVGPAHFENARTQALIWALERGSRSGRVAFQFAKDFAGQGVGT